MAERERLVNENGEIFYRTNPPRYGAGTGANWPYPSHADGSPALDRPDGRPVPQNRRRGGGQVPGQMGAVEPPRVQDDLSDRTEGSHLYPRGSRDEEFPQRRKPATPAREFPHGPDGRWPQQKQPSDPGPGAQSAGGSMAKPKKGKGGKAPKRFSYREGSVHVHDHYHVGDDLAADAHNLARGHVGALNGDENVDTPDATKTMFGGAHRNPVNFMGVAALGERVATFDPVQEAAKLMPPGVAGFRAGAVNPSAAHMARSGEAPASAANDASVPDFNAERAGSTPGRVAVGQPDLVQHDPGIGGIWARLRTQRGNTVDLGISDGTAGGFSHEGRADLQNADFRSQSGSYTGAPPGTFANHSPLRPADHQSRGSGTSPNGTHVTPSPTAGTGRGGMSIPGNSATSTARQSMKGDQPSRLAVMKELLFG